MDIVKQLQDAVAQHQGTFSERNKEAMEFYEKMKLMGIAKPDTYNIRPIGQPGKPEDISYLMR